MPHPIDKGLSRSELIQHALKSSVTTYPADDNGDLLIITGSTLRELILVSKEVLSSVSDYRH